MASVQAPIERGRIQHHWVSRVVGWALLSNELDELILTRKFLKIQPLSAITLKHSPQHSIKHTANLSPNENECFFRIEIRMKVELLRIKVSNSLQ
jgi:hypothetical protein